MAAGFFQPLTVATVCSTTATVVTKSSVMILVSVSQVAYGLAPSLIVSVSAIHAATKFHGILVYECMLYSTVLISDLVMMHGEHSFFFDYLNLNNTASSFILIPSSRPAW